MNSNEIQARLATLKAQIDAHLKRDDFDEDDRSMDDVHHEYETLLVKTWMDENGLLTGAIPYIEETMKPKQFYYSGDTAEQMFEVKHGEDEDHDFVEDSAQIGLFRTLRKNRPALCRVSYQNALAHHVEINQYEATISVTEGGTPYKVYRPFLNADGTSSYRLVREVVVVKHDIDQVPSFLNYALVQADGRLYKLLEGREDFDEDVWHEMFMELALGERRLPNFNDIPTSSEVASWLHDYLAKLDQLSTRGAGVPLEEIIAVSNEAGRAFHALTQDVKYHYDQAILSDELTTENTDGALEDIDGSLPGHEVARY